MYNSCKAQKKASISMSSFLEKIPSVFIRWFFENILSKQVFRVQKHNLWLIFLIEWFYRLREYRKVDTDLRQIFGEQLQVTSTENVSKAVTDVELMDILTGNDIENIGF